MRRFTGITLLANCWIWAAVCAHGQCGVRPYSDFESKARRVVIDDVDFVGTVSLPEPEIARAVTGAKALRLHDDPGWLETVEAEVETPWRDDGFQTASVKLTPTTVSSDDSALHVKLRAQVDEGPRYKLKSIEFRNVTDNDAIPSQPSGIRLSQRRPNPSALVFSSQELRNAIPMADGDLFSSAKVVDGLQALGELYGALGYINLIATPDMEFDGGTGTIKLTFELDEGKQVHIRNIDVSRLDPAIRSKLKLRVESGDVLTSNLFDTFVGDNGSLAPKGSHWCMWAGGRRDEALVDVYFDLMPPQF
jgi:outer membrane protein assembly factor BamA